MRLLQVPAKRKLLKAEENDGNEDVKEDIDKKDSNPKENDKGIVVTVQRGGGSQLERRLLQRFLVSILLGLVSLLRGSLKFQFQSAQQSTQPESQKTSTSKRARSPGQLRLDWTNLPVQSYLAQEIQQHQSNCELPLRYFEPRNNAGLGSDLHVYGMALCAAHRLKSRMFTAFPWMYWDETICDTSLLGGSSMSCYFPKLELSCPTDHKLAQQFYQESQQLEEQLAHSQSTTTTTTTTTTKHSLKRVAWEAHEDQACHSILHQSTTHSNLFKIYDIRSAITELQFSAVSDIVLKEAQRQHALVFKNAPNGKMPPSHQLISVHVRWGDKGSEMALQPIPTYIRAIQKIARKRSLKPNQVHIFLATEDPRAVTQFQQAMHPQWTLYVDQFYVEMLPHRNNQTMEVAGAAKEGYGKTGLLALGSLLVTMESDSYVLSTGSNWSRMMNELRKSILRPRKCPQGPQYASMGSAGIAPDIWYNGTLLQDCTMLVDVQPSFSEYETGELSPQSQHQATFTSKHQTILQKLKLLQQYRASDNKGGISAHKIIMIAGPRTRHVDTKILDKPQSMLDKEQHMKNVKYPRLIKRQNNKNKRHPRRQLQSLMKFVKS